MNRDLTDPLAEGTLLAAWARHFREQPERPAVREVGGEWLSYGELDRRSREAAAALAARGLAAGERVVLSAGTSTALVVAYVAALRLGAAVVPLNGAYRRAEVEAILADAEPAGAIVDDPERAKWMAGLRFVCGVEIGPAAGSGAARGGEPELDRAAPEDLALLPYTSGTTGAPKGAMLSHRNLLASAEALRRAWRWTLADRLVLALPLFHVHGLGVGLNGTLAAGASAVLLPRFEPDAVLDAIAAEEATIFFGVPTMYSRLLDSPRVGELRRLRFCACGSAPLPAKLHREVASRGGQEIVERYGMTETLMNSSNPYEGERRPGTVGMPLPGVELRLAADGEILLRGPNVFAGYWRNPKATAAAFDADGWFRSGDLGEWSEDGYLTIVGRSKELIISGGYNVYPREVEDALREHPSVADAAVAGISSEEWGETVGAWVVARDPELDAEALIAFATERLVGYKRPRRVRFVAELPRNALGKVVKGELPGR